MPITELLLHISGPSSKGADDRARALALAYPSFVPVRSVSFAPNPIIPLAPARSEPATHLGPGVSVSFQDLGDESEGRHGDREENGGAILLPTTLVDEVLAGVWAAKEAWVGSMDVEMHGQVEIQDVAGVDAAVAPLVETERTIPMVEQEVAGAERYIDDTPGAVAALESQLLTSSLVALWSQGRDDRDATIRPQGTEEEEEEVDDGGGDKGIGGWAVGMSVPAMGSLRRETSALRLEREVGNTEEDAVEERSINGNGSAAEDENGAQGSRKRARTPPDLLGEDEADAPLASPSRKRKKSSQIPEGEGEGQGTGIASRLLVVDHNRSDDHSHNLRDDSSYDRSHNDSHNHIQDNDTITALHSNNPPTGTHPPPSNCPPSTPRSPKPQLANPLPSNHQPPETPPSNEAPTLRITHHLTHTINPPTPPPALHPPPRTLTTPALRHLTAHASLRTRYQPISQTRTPNPLERGYWLVPDAATARWPAPLRRDAWRFLEEFVGAGHAGWGVACVRFVHDDVGNGGGEGEVKVTRTKRPGERAAKIDTDGEGAATVKEKQVEEGWGALRVYCWGELVQHIYLLLFVASQSKIARAGAVWVDADGVVVVKMP